MKKHLFLSLLIALAVLAVLLTLPAFAAGDAETPLVVLTPTNTIYLDAVNGKDTGTGAKDSPFKTFKRALTKVEDGGTIQIVGTLALSPDSSNDEWTAHGKTITITGGKLDLTAYVCPSSASPRFEIRDNVTFTNIELTFPTVSWGGENSSTKKDGSTCTYVFANGYHVVIAPDVVFTDAVNTNIYLFGGGRSTTVNGDTNLEVYAGTYTAIYGGNYSGTLNGSTHLTVGGNVNPTALVTNHTDHHCIYGGGRIGTIKGDTNLVIQDNAKAIYAQGGSQHVSSYTTVITGTMNVTMTGGSLMHLAGANVSGANTGSGVNLTMTGGTVYQIFGGSRGGSLGSASTPFNITMRLLGGTVKRRIYGGCYNDYGFLSGYSTTYHVYGKITMIIGPGLDAKLNTDSDRNFVAYSRYTSVLSGESGEMIFLGDTAYNNVKNVLGPGRSDAGIMSKVKTAADDFHTLNYTFQDGVLTETCSYTGHSHSATATLALDPNVSLTYKGQPIEPATFTYGSGWMGEQCFEISYANNNAPGTATATASSYYTTASLDFTIEGSTGDYGDSNGDGMIDGQDIILIKQYLASFDYTTGKSDVFTAPGADANGDGTIDGQDIILLKQYLAAFDYEKGTSDVPLGPR